MLPVEGFWMVHTNVNGVLTVTPEDATFSFATNNYCQSGTDPTPSLSGVTGGTFSAPAGLSINTSSGEIDLSGSTPGTYSVTYVTPNCGSSSNFTVTITPDEDGTFSYSTTQFCTGGAGPNPYNFWYNRRFV